MKPQVIVADDHRLVAEGIVKILEKAYSVVAMPANGRSFIEAVEKFHPELAVVDIEWIGCLPPCEEILPGSQDYHSDNACGAALCERSISCRSRRIRFKNLGCG